VIPASNTGVLKHKNIPQGSSSSHAKSGKEIVDQAFEELNLYLSNDGECSGLAVQKRKFSHPSEKSKSVNLPNANGSQGMGALKASSSHPNPPGVASLCYRNALSDHTKLLPSLRKFLRRADAWFKSELQLRAVSEALRNNEDFLLVMPTDAGKSLAYILPAFIEGGSRLTLVVVPLVALIGDLTERCRSVGIRVGTWENCNVPSLQVLLVAVEQVGTPQYVEQIGVFCNGGRLARIVVEEAHLTCMWAEFRPQMLALQIRYALLLSLCNEFFSEPPCHRELRPFWATSTECPAFKP